MHHRQKNKIFWFIFSLPSLQHLHNVRKQNITAVFWARILRFCLSWLPQVARRPFGFMTHFTVIVTAMHCGLHYKTKLKRSSIPFLDARGLSTAVTYKVSYSLFRKFVFSKALKYYICIYNAQHRSLYAQN